jgi:hypothetical protein
MKSLFVSVLALAAPCVVLAQAAPPAKAPQTKPASAASAAPAKKSAGVRRSARKAVEEVTPIDTDPGKMTDADLEIAKRVHTGVIPCELGASVTVTANEKRPGFFLVQTKTARFNMRPAESRTGAIRLEDAKAGAMWLQLGNKSMLMSQKHGQRLADECMSPSQLTMADDLKKNPVPGLLDAPKPVALVPDAMPGRVPTAAPESLPTAAAPAASAPK